jgi:hypothetical protein
MAKVYSLTVRNRAAAALLGIGVVALGLVFLTLGFALLLGLVVAGGVLGTGVAVYRRLRGAGAPRRTASPIDLAGLTEIHSPRNAGLDPTLEVKPTIKAIVRPLDENE